MNKYKLYDVYGINKNELLNRNALLAETTTDINSYYKGMKEIIASLNSCHMRLATSKDDDVESPSQPVYFYNINNELAVSAIFDPTLENKIMLGDKLLSINNIPIDQLYKDFSKYVFASTIQQRNMKITQRLLHTALEIWGDSLLLEFQNNTNTYSIYLSKTNFFGKRVIPKDFRLASNNIIEKYDKIIYFRPNFWESLTNPLLYSYKEDFNNCEGVIVDLRSCSSGDYSCLTFFSFLISENSHVLFCDSSIFNLRMNYIIKPSQKIQIKAPIVIIIDAKTTCIHELFINALRKNRSD
ncbi:MAG: hypothetical protein LBD23_11760, partial [Oscillospiraceae bacterium]|nr:hypothetical protein [Oscillospiraceae bacterium]